VLSVLNPNVVSVFVPQVDHWTVDSTSLPQLVVVPQSPARPEEGVPRPGGHPAAVGPAAGSGRIVWLKGCDCSVTSPELPVAQAKFISVVHDQAVMQWNSCLFVYDITEDKCLWGAFLLLYTVYDLFIYKWLTLALGGDFLSLYDTNAIKK